MGREKRHECIQKVKHAPLSEFTYKIIVHLHGNIDARNYPDNIQVARGNKKNDKSEKQKASTRPLFK